MHIQLRRVSIEKYYDLWNLYNSSLKKNPKPEQMAPKLGLQ